MTSTDHPHTTRRIPSRTRVSRSTTGLDRVVATTVDDYHRYLAAGRHRIDIRRTPLDPAEPIDLGVIATHLEIRVTGRAHVIIAGGHLHLTDASTAEVLGDATVHAYSRATATGFDTATLHGHNHSTLHLCDRARAAGHDQTTITVWDPTPTITADDQTRILIAAPHLADTARLHIDGQARIYTPIPVHPTGPARSHITHSRDPLTLLPSRRDPLAG